ncbi:MAG: hypothetical protein AAFV93_22675 [Chloroflexota bacterium]
MKPTGMWLEIGREQGEYKEGDYLIKLRPRDGKWESYHDPEQGNQLYLQPHDTFEDALAHIRWCMRDDLEHN